MISLRSPLDHKHITHDRCRWQQQEWDKMKKNYEIVLVEGKIPRMVCAVFTCQGGGRCLASAREFHPGGGYDRILS